MLTFDQLPLILAQNADQPSVDGASNTDAKTGDAKVTDKAADTQTTDKTVDTAKDQAPLPKDSRGGQGGFEFFLPIMIGFIVLMFIFSSRSQKKQKKQRETMIDSLKKGARVQSIGGILGTVVEVRDNKVILKIDENNNTRMQMAKSAIQSVLEDKSDTKEAELDKKD